MSHLDFDPRAFTSYQERMRGESAPLEKSAPVRPHFLWTLATVATCAFVVVMVFT